MSTVLQSKHVKIAKPHKCWGCLREFPKGTKMHYNVTVDVIPFSSYWCETCEEIISEIGSKEFEDGIGRGEIIENYPEYFKVKQEGGEG